MNSLFEEITSIAKEQGADYVGVADLTEVHDEIFRQGGEVISSYPRAIVTGIGLSNDIVDQLGHPEDPASKINYSHHGYNIINIRMDILVSRIAELIQQKGFKSLPVPTSVRVDDKRICSFFSHKLAARQAGFGWIGKSCMLITPDHGPRVRWGSVLCDAPLPISSGPVEEQCGSCHACVDICPVHAFTGEPFREGEPREVRYAADRCDQYFKDLASRNEEAVCGLCLYVCPYGRKNRL